MNTSKIIDNFNITIEEFITKMINQFPLEKKLTSYYSKFKIAKMIDKTIPIKIYMGGCLEFKQQIKDRDSDFFKNRSSFVNKCVKYSHSFSSDIGIVNYWESLSNESKKAIWDYIQTLFVMGEMYISNNDEILNKIKEEYSNFKADNYSE